MTVPGADASPSVFVTVPSQTLVKGLLRACWICWDSRKGVCHLSWQAHLSLSWGVLTFRISSSWMLLVLGVILGAGVTVLLSQCFAHFHTEAIDGKSQSPRQVQPSSQGTFVFSGSVIANTPRTRRHAARGQ